MNRILSALFIVLLACDTKPQTENHGSNKLPKRIEATGWLIGMWSAQLNDRSSFEEWKKFNDSVYVGRSYSIDKGDTVSSESIKLVQQGEEIHYIPTVKDQNNNMPVAFRLTLLDSSTMIFENQAHDFPQRITYRRISPDSLVAEISGTIKGEYNAQQFPMRMVE